MPNVLIRGIPPALLRKIKEFARSEDLPIDQFILRMIEKQAKRAMAEEKKERERKAFRCIDEINEDNFWK